MPKEAKIGVAKGLQKSYNFPTSTVNLILNKNIFHISCRYQLIVFIFAEL